MVNPRRTDLPPAVLAEIRDRALQATDVSIVITDALQEGSPIVWVNHAFTLTTGYAIEEVVGRNPNLLHGPGTDRDQARRIGQAVAEERAVTVTVLNYRSGGAPFWNHVSVSPVRDGDGRVTHWVGVQVDVTAQVNHADAQRQSIEAERRARIGLALVSRVSDILSDLANPHVLGEIAALLRGDVVEWAGFFVEDGGLRAADGIDVSLHLSECVRRPADAGHVATRRVVDPVRELLDGEIAGPIEVPLTGESAGPTTVALVRRLATMLGDGPRTVVLHALQGRRANLGLLATVPTHGEGLAGLDDTDRTVLHLVVRRVGMAVDNARLFAREHRLAETLQRAMLPEQAEVSDLDVWTYYAPSSGHAQVGGDWYDVLQVSPDVVAVVIGDVVGHDVEAAAAMGQLRSVVRSYAFESAEPGAVLNRVDQLVTGMRVPRSASLVLATLTRRDDGWLLQYSRAGHLPPLVIRDNETMLLDGAGGSLIGFGKGGRSTASVDLGPGDVLVLYTGGLIERRNRTLRDGLATLGEVAAASTSTDAAGIGEELLSRLADAPEDDIAVVVVRVPDPGRTPTGTGSPRRRRWSLPAEPTSVGRARHAVARTCAAWGIPGSSSAELVVSELVANAVMHGWGHVVLRLFDTGEGLRIEVEDANPAPPVTTDGHSGRVGGFGMRVVERLGDWGWRPSADGKLVWALVRPQGFDQPAAQGADPSI